MPTHENTHDPSREPPRLVLWLATFHGHPKRGGLENSVRRADVTAARWRCLDMLTTTNVDPIETEAIRFCRSEVTHVAFFSLPEGGDLLRVVDLCDPFVVTEPETNLRFSPGTITAKIERP